MPRTGKRITITRGIYRDGPNGPYEIRVTVGGESFLARMPADSTPDELKARRVALELQGRTEAAPARKRGTLAADAPRYINLMKHLESWKDREAHLKAWVARHGS